MLGEEPAEHRPAHRRYRKHRADVALITSAFARRDDVGDDGLRQRHQAAAAETLERAAQHQRRHARRQRASDRTDDKNDDRGQHQNAPPVNIGEFAVERRYRRAGEQIGRHHPGQVVDVAEMTADGRQRGGDNGLVERAEEHRQHNAEHDGPDFRMRERRQLRRRLRLRRPRLGSGRFQCGFAPLGFHRSRLGFRFGGGHGAVCNSKPATRSMPCRFRQCKTSRRGGAMCGPEGPKSARSR